MVQSLLRLVLKAAHLNFFYEFWIHLSLVHRRQLIHSAARIHKMYKFQSNVTLYRLNLNRDFGEIFFAGIGIWTHDALTRVFLQEHFLSYRST